MQPGNSATFSFVSADTPAMVFGDSQFYNNPPVGTSFVYNALPFSDQGFQFVVAVAPTVTGLNPTSGPAAGGTTVTITGTGLPVRRRSTSAPRRRRM